MTNDIRTTLYLISRILLRQAIKLEYAMKSYLSFFAHSLAGGSPETRLSGWPELNYIGSASDKSSTSRIALFTAFHDSNGISDSNLRYVQALQSCKFRIIYIHNGIIAPSDIEKLKPYCERILCRKNIGQDFGAFKDGYLYCKSKKLLDGVEWLLLCNDSNLFLGGEHAATFTQSFKRALKQSKYELISLNKNYEYLQHYQSFFNCFHQRLFEKSKFKHFWQNYLPLSNRYHAIKWGEMELTRSVIKSAHAKVLYDSPALHKAISQKSLTIEEVFQLLPKNVIRLLSPEQQHLHHHQISKITVHQIFACLDVHNPSHAYALLMVKFLKSPFLKKDLFRHGHYTLPQIASMLEDEGFSCEESTWTEIIRTYSSSGSNVSYLWNQREAYKKAIPNSNSCTFHGHGYISITRNATNASTPSKWIENNATKRGLK